MQQRETTLRFLARPTDVNFGGKMHGGEVMKWIDEAGYACAVGWSGRYCVTVYVGGIRFHRPILIGSLVQVRACIIYTGKSSMHITVDVSSADPKDGVFARTTHCVIVFVAMDEAGALVEVPKWQPRTPQDQELERYALRLMELRKGIEDEMSRHQLEPDAAPSDPSG